MSEPRSSLARLQAWMQDALIAPRQISEAERDRIVEPSSRLSGAQRLAIYQRSYRLRLRSCMREQFPALSHALGGQLFDDFCDEYLRAYPPTSHTLFDLGARFAAYLEEARPDRDEAADRRETWIDFMVDLARFERALFVLFDAPGHEERPFADADCPDERLRLQPAVRLGDFRFPVARYYYEVRDGRDPQLPPLQRAPVALVRKDYRTHTFPLTTVQHEFLTAMLEGEDIHGAIAVAARTARQAPERVYQSWRESGSTRERWLAAGFFIDAGPAAG